MRLLVVGDVILDRDLDGSVSRVAPDAPVPVVDLAVRHERPGGAGLAAAMLAAGGAEVTLATCIGDDATGRRLRELLTGVHIVELAVVPATRSVTRVRSAGQALLRVDEPGTPVTAAIDVDTGGLAAALETADAVHVADYGAGVASQPQVRAALAAWTGRRPVVWDPHPRGADPVAGVTVATPNRAEVAQFVSRHGLTPATAGLDGAAEALRARWGALAVAATDGGTGVYTAVAGSAPLFTPTPTEVPGDTCGAGDRFAGAVAAALALAQVSTSRRDPLSGSPRLVQTWGSGSDVAQAVGRAVVDVAGWLAAGGVATASTPTPVATPTRALATTPTPALATTPTPVATPTPPAIMHGLSHPGADPPPDGHTVHDRGGVEPVVAAVRQRGGTVVATGGCFDVLHAGHVASLQAARRLGDCLVVLLNSDDSVRRLKGPSRPVHGVDDRRRVLESLECVDAVIVFDGDDPREALDRLRPDVWAKGGDYAEADLPEARLLRQWGGRLVLLPFLPDRSTTRILAHAANSPHPPPAARPERAARANERQVAP